ncbi:unnamed protein product [Sphagnum balticum]
MHSQHPPRVSTHLSVPTHGGPKGRELAEGHVMSVGAVEGLKGRELVECHVIMSSVASAIPTSNHKKNECGLSVL